MAICVIIIVTKCNDFVNKYLGKKILEVLTKR